MKKMTIINLKNRLKNLIPKYEDAALYHTDSDEEEIVNISHNDLIKMYVFLMQFKQFLDDLEDYCQEKE